MSREASVVFAISLALAVVLTACATSTSAAREEAEFRRAAEEVFAKWGEANLSADAESYVALWDEGFVKMAAGKPTVIGLDDLAERKRRGYERFVYETFHVDFEEVQVAGDFAWVRGTYVVGGRPAGGGETSVSEGCFLTIFKRQADGSWKVYRDTMMNAPAR